MTNQRRFGLGIAIAAALLVAIVLQWRHVIQRRAVDRVEVALEQATLIRIVLARAALASARETSGDPTVSDGDVHELLDRAQLALQDWQHGRKGSAGVREIPALSDSLLRPLATRLEGDLRLYRASIGSSSPTGRVEERSRYTAVTARADSIFFLANMEVLRQRRVDNLTHVIWMASAAFTIALLAGILLRLAAKADAASARSDALRSLAEALAAARTSIDVARATREVIGGALGTSFGETSLVRDDGRTLDVVECARRGDAAALPVDDDAKASSVLVARALSTHRLAVDDGLSGEYIDPSSPKRTQLPSGLPAIAALPLVASVDGVMRTIGAITFEFEAPRSFEEEDRRFLEAVANVTAQAMTRALASQAVEMARADALRERARLGKILDRLPVGVVVIDEHQTVVHQNSSLARLLGHEVTEGAHVWSAASRADGSPFEESDHPLARALREDRAIGQELTRYRRDDGSTAFLRFSIVPLRLDEGTRRAVVATVEDVSELQRAERALADSEARHRSTAERLPVGIYRADADGRITYVNPRVAELYGAKATELASYDWLRYVHSDDRERVVNEGNEMRVRGVGRARLQFRIVRPSDGEVRHMFSDMVYLRGADGTLDGMLGVLEDVTERDLLEAQLRQAQKMEAVGRLAGGIAHDFNNLLTVIGGISDLLLRQETLPEDIRPDIEQVRDSSNRAADLTRQLLTFSRQQTLQIRDIDVRYVVEHSLKFVRRVIGEHIEITVVSDTHLPMARADAGALEQILINLVVNARDAMSDGGHLRIRTTECNGDRPSVVPVAASAGFVCIEVSDDGSGIDPAIRNQIFDPFFTTKEVGRGTGLGLSMVYGLVEQMQGWIDVESTMGVGSTFRVHLPIAHVQSEPAQSDVPRGIAMRGSETILLVEDEPAVRRLAHRTLSQLGYHVLDAPDAASALQLAEGHPRIDMLITDVVLPGRSGASLADELLAARPGLQVLFMSGYTADHALRRRIADGVPFLAKPYTPSALAERVRGLLNSASPVC